MKNILIFITTALWSLSALAAPLDSCPNEAFLVQGSPAKMYGVDLSTGSYRTLASDMGAKSVLNAIAFNFHDQYLYAWDKAEQTLARIDSNFQRKTLSLKSGLSGHYYVGDVSPQENAYFIYRKGSHALHGLWRIDLDETSVDYLDPVRIIDGSSLYLNIYDFAFHPDDNHLYSVDSKGNLIKIDAVTGSSQKLGQVGISGTFGAVYFDIDGNFYISRNKDGLIFKIDIASGNYQAQQFAQGPSSSSNDGARCAFAPVEPVDSTKVDFGDAPDSYQTSMGANGARHDVTNAAIYFGDSVDGEVQAFVAPNSDDSTSEDDEDGIHFLSSPSAGNRGLVNIDVKGGGYVHAWMDFDRNGRFDSSDKIVDGKFLDEGQHQLTYEVPVSARQGSTWARFRISSSRSLEAFGGVSDGEVEDHQVQISTTVMSKQYYPNASSYVTIAFEDLWPSVGDYDMNDFVVHYRTGFSTVGSKVTAVSIAGEILAMGATFHNGFAVQIEGLERSFIDESSIEFEINGVMQRNNPLESGQSNAVFVVANDLWDYVEPAEGCTFYRTESNCGESPIQFGFRIDAELSVPIERTDLKAGFVQSVPVRYAGVQPKFHLQFTSR